MYTSLKNIFTGVFLVSLFAACEDGFKSYSNDNTSRPTYPDMNDRNIGNDGTSDKLIDPFYKGGKKWDKERNQASNEDQYSEK